jgi:threonyl-tRNA synthetase
MKKDIEKIRHSLSHLLAFVIKKAFPEVKFGIGPIIENGFYYDIDFGENSFGEADLPVIESKMREVIDQDLAFEVIEKDIDEAIEEEKTNGQEFKVDLLEELKSEGEKIVSYYRLGDFEDLCRGPHINYLKEIDPDSFKLSHVAGAYWRGDEKNKMLTRIYGLAFDSADELEDYVLKQEEIRKSDHKRLGKELDLFCFSETVGKGLPLWTEKGTAIRRELERFIVDEEIKRGYIHVMTPDIAKLDLYIKSGHYPHYKDSMYAPIKIEDEEFMLRPMTCPHHFELYSRKIHSYRDLPFRIAEIAKLYRFEQSGELSGLLRVRSFSLADAHIICASEEQAVEEIDKALDLIEFVSETFGLKKGEDFWYSLSLGDRSDNEKYFKNDEAWELAEDLLRKHLNSRGVRFDEKKGEAAFYGPKIDIQMRNVNGKEDTAFTVQYDFSMPEQFDLTYIDHEGNKKRAFVVHRSSIGAIERTIAFLIEHYGGSFPVWLAPIQAKIISVSDDQINQCERLKQRMLEEGLRPETDTSNETVGNKIRKAIGEKVPYMVVIGPKEVELNNVTVRKRDDDHVRTMKEEDFLSELKEIYSKRL